jgi:Holliday junction resolvase RusA-like endonuclease
MEITFTAYGKAAPQGSRQPHAVTYKDGTAVRRHAKTCPGSVSKTRAREYAGKPCKCPIMVTHVEDDFGKRLNPWRREVTGEACQAMNGEPPLACLVVVTMEFFRPRPKAHYGSGRNARVLKDSAPSAPGTAPDLGKQARAIQDAMSKIVYTDDSMIVSEVHVKRYIDSWEREHVRVTVTPAPQQTVGDLVAAGVVELLTPEHPDQLALPLAEAA